MHIKEAQQEVDKRIREYGGYWQPLSMFARLAEETGEVGRAMNVLYGDKRKKHEEDGKELKEELADVFFTLLAMCNALEIDIEKEFLNKNNKTHDKYKEAYNPNGSKRHS